MVFLRFDTLVFSPSIYSLLPAARTAAAKKPAVLTWPCLVPVAAAVHVVRVVVAGVVVVVRVVGLWLCVRYVCACVIILGCVNLEPVILSQRNDVRFRYCSRALYPIWRRKCSLRAQRMVHRCGLDFFMG